MTVFNGLARSGRRPRADDCFSVWMLEGMSASKFVNGRANDEWRLWGKDGLFLSPIHLIFWIQELLD